MNRKRILILAAASLAGLIAVVVICGILVVRTAWFRESVRTKVITTVEEASGGKVDVGSFDFDWTHLRATLRNVVVHGTEGPDQAPLLRVKLIQLDLKLFSGLHQAIDLAALQVQQPEANILVDAQGGTNIPEPKVKTKSDKSALATVVDLKVGVFNLTDGTASVNARKLNYNARGENLRAQLMYSALGDHYQGQLNIDPLLVSSDGKQPLRLSVSLPVTLERDRIRLADAKIATAASQVTFNTTIDRLNDPRTSLQARAHLALADVGKFIDLPLQQGTGLPSAVDAEVSANIDQTNIQVSTARASLGDSSLEASGNSSQLRFNSSLAVAQLGRLFKVSAQPGGFVTAAGTAQLSPKGDYAVDASVNGKDLSFRNGDQTYRNLALIGQLKADPQRIALEAFKIFAFGGEVDGTATLAGMRHYEFNGQLRNFEIATLAKTFAQQTLPYDGVISGPVNVSGDLKGKPVASVQLAIAPRGTGVPVTGKIQGDYNGNTELISLADSYIALPNTRLDLSGALQRSLNIQLVSHNLNDLQPALGEKPLPVQLAKAGSVKFQGTVTGKLNAPRLQGHLEALNFTLQDRPFDRLSTDVSASSTGAAVQAGSLVRGASRVEFAGSTGLHRWKPESKEPVSLTASIRDADLADLLAIAGQKDIPATGIVSAQARVVGTIGNPQGHANLSVLNGTAYDEKFDRLTANVEFQDQLVQLNHAQLVAGTAQIDAGATFRHPKDSFGTGVIEARLNSNRMSLDQFQAVKKQTKGLSGTAELKADLTANVFTNKGKSEVLLSSFNASANGQGFRFEGRNLGDFSATAQTSGQVVSFNVSSDFAGSSVKATGQTRLEHDYPTTASASISNLPIEQVLAIADRKDIPAKGLLNGTAQVSGTLDSPQASGDLTLTKANLYQEPLDRVQARFAYTDRRVEVSNFEVVEGASRLDGSGQFDHPKGDLQQGQLQFRLASNQVQLGRLHIVQQQRPGLNGTLALNVQGAGALQKLPKGSTAPAILFRTLNADVSARGLEVNKKALGDLTLEAETRGNDLAFKFESNVGKSNIHGQGVTQLQGDYPTTAQVSFSNLTYLGLQPLISTASTVKPTFDLTAEGQATVSGPAAKPEQLTGTLTLSKLLFNSPAYQEVNLQNQGPIVIALGKSQTLTVQNAHITGRETDITLAGTAALDPAGPLNLQLNANTNLKILRQFDKDIYSDGAVAVKLAVRGTSNQPFLNGQMTLQNASLNLVDIPNGISNANGVVQFNGTTAVVQNLTAESGGGKVTMGGFVGFTNGILRYGLRANANQVRVRTAEGASLVASSALNLTGTSDHSVLGGTVTINRIGFNPRSDFGSLLSRSSPPTQTVEAPSGPLAGMKLDIRVRTATDVAVQTSLAQNLQADADLTIRGTISSPGVLGRVNVTSGKLVFFGTDYDVNSGNVSFFNPLAIEPILNVNLETKAQGVDVVLTVSGPVNNMKLTYRSDPPLQFDEILSLLAAGKTPTSDPTILASQPAPAPQSLQQMGESAIVSQAVASPLSNRLQRVFGVSKLKIDPAFTAGSTLPQARLTLQQQVANSVTFTYVTDVTQANSQLIRVEWSLNPQWSAVATRDEYGRFGVDFFFKKQFR